MSHSIKVIITSKTNLQNKYEKKFTAVDKLLRQLAASDKKRQLDTHIIYIDDKTSCKKVGIKPVAAVTKQSAKEAVDAVARKLNPAYILLFGSQDIFPFQEVKNPAKDDDPTVPTDLPYACESAYGTDVSAYTGPVRVVGRIPDIPATVDMKYLGIVFKNIIGYKKIPSAKLDKYFSVSAYEWRKSTAETITNLFGNAGSLKLAPPAKPAYTAKDLSPLVHFYNCHGSPIDSNFYGQKGKQYPVAQHSANLNGKISTGTVVASECCYGATVYNPDSEDSKSLSIANTYFYNHAISFVGSSTVAYGPATGQGLADLITQYFVRNVKQGASTGRAFLEARQKFLSVSGPHLDVYELKTLAQFYLLGDPSVQVVEDIQVENGADSISNRRLNLFNKGLNLHATIAPSGKMKKPASKKTGKHPAAVKDILRQSGFSGEENEYWYKVKMKNKKMDSFAKGFLNKTAITFRTFIQNKHPLKKDTRNFSVLVIKQCGEEVLGWKVYHRKS